MQKEVGGRCGLMLRGLRRAVVDAFRRLLESPWWRTRHAVVGRQTSVPGQRGKPERQTRLNIAFFESPGTLWWAAVPRR